MIDRGPMISDPTKNSEIEQIEKTIRFLQDRVKELNGHSSNIRRLAHDLNQHEPFHIVEIKTATCQPTVLTLRELKDIIDSLRLV